MNRVIQLKKLVEYFEKVNRAITFLSLFKKLIKSSINIFFNLLILYILIKPYLKWESNHLNAIFKIITLYLD